MFCEAAVEAGPVWVEGRVERPLLRVASTQVVRSAEQGQIERPLPITGRLRVDRRRSATGTQNQSERAQAAAGTIPAACWDEPLAGTSTRFSFFFFSFFVARSLSLSLSSTVFHPPCLLEQSSSGGAHRHSPLSLLPRVLFRRRRDPAKSAFFSVLGAPTPSSSFTIQPLPLQVAPQKASLAPSYRLVAAASRRRAFTRAAETKQHRSNQARQEKDGRNTRGMVEGESDRFLSLICSLSLLCRFAVFFLSSHPRLRLQPCPLSDQRKLSRPSTPARS